MMEGKVTAVEAIITKWDPDASSFAKITSLFYEDLKPFRFHSPFPHCYSTREPILELGGNWDELTELRNWGGIEQLTQFMNCPIRNNS